MIYILFLFVFLSTLPFLVYEAVFINWLLCNTISKIKNLSFYSVKQEPQGRNSFELYILLPVLNEIDALKKAVDHFVRMDCCQYKVVIITTQKQLVNKIEQESIYDVALQLKALYPLRIEVIHYPYITGNKASQLNYALTQLPSDNEAAYVGIYDVDSRPDLNTIMFMEHELHNYPGDGPAFIIQQPTLFFENMQSLSPYLQMEAILQTRRSLGIEIPTNLNTIREYKNPFLPVPYCVGHGLFIQLPFLIQNKGFPEPLEDIPFGVRASIKRIPIIPLLGVFDNAEVAPTFFKLVKQSGVWFECTLLGFKEAMRHFSLRTSWTWSIILKSFLDVCSWSAFLLHVLGGTYLLLQGLYWLCLPSVILILVNAIVSVFSVVPIYERRKNVKVRLSCRLLFCTLYPLRECIRGLAPIVYLFGKLKKGKWC